MKRIKWLCLVLGLLTVSCQANKQKETEIEQVTNDGIKTITVGEGVRVTWISDNAEEHLTPVSTFPDAPATLIEELNIQDGLKSTVSTFLVETEGIKILFDTGIGGPNSCLTNRLQELGISPSDIKYLYLTHYHGDHIGGMLQGDTLTFPNAEVYASRVEHEAWMSMDEEKNRLQQKTMESYRQQLHFFEYGDTLPGKVVAIEAIGHTPGHTVFQVGKLLIIADLIHGAELQLSHPEICAKYDMDKQQAIESRKRILEYASANELIMAGMHLPAPGFIE